MSELSGPRQLAGGSAPGIDPVWQAARDGATAELERLLDSGKDVNARVAEQEAGLLSAIRCGEASLAELLRPEDAGTTPLLCSALCASAAAGHTDTALLLLSRGYAPAPCDAVTVAVLSMRGDGDAVLRALLSRAPHLGSARLLGDWAPIMLAAERGHAGAVSALLDAGANADAATADGTTALLLAAQNGCVGVIDALVCAGADVRGAATEDGTTPLLAAAVTGEWDAVFALAKAGASLSEARASDRATALLAAAEDEEGEEIVVRLLQAGASPNPSPTTEGVTPLMAAAGSGLLGSVTALLEAGADVNAAAEDGTTALLHAAQEGHADVVRELLGRGANPDAADDTNWTPTMAAAEAGAEAVVRALVEAGADIRVVTTDDGMTAADVAAAAEHDEIAAMLR